MKAWKLVLAAVLALAFCSPSMAQDEKKGKRGNQATPEETFKKMDANGDGKVTKDELEKWVKANERLAKRAEQDTEFVNKMFTSMDANKDGSVTLEEYKKYREEQNAKRKKKDPA
jgi:Ca2+-binding EF-hand superfamily protein